MVQKIHLSNLFDTMLMMMMMYQTIMQKASTNDWLLEALKETEQKKKLSNMEKS